MKKLFSLILFVLIAGSTWAGNVNVKDCIPGTDADNLGKERSTAAGASDVGVAVYGERRDNLIALEEADGEYTGPKYDSSGKMYTHPGELISVSASFTPDDSPDYTATYAAGGRLEFPNAVLVAGGKFEIVSAMLSDTENLQNTSDFYLVILDRTFSATPDNTALAFDDTEITQILTVISFDDDANDRATNIGFASNGIIWVRDINVGCTLEASTTSIFAQCRINGASNYAAAQTVTITLFLRRL